MQSPFFFLSLRESSTVTFHIKSVSGTQVILFSTGVNLKKLSYVSNLNSSVNYTGETWISCFSKCGTPIKGRLTKLSSRVNKRLETLVTDYIDSPTK